MKRSKRKVVQSCLLVMLSALVVGGLASGRTCITASADSAKRSFLCKDRKNNLRFIRIVKNSKSSYKYKVKSLKYNINV